MIGGTHFSNPYPLRSFKEKEEKEAP